MQANVVLTVTLRRDFEKLVNELRKSKMAPKAVELQAILPLMTIDREKIDGEEIIDVMEVANAPDWPNSLV